MKFGIEKCAMLIMEIGRRESAEGIELPNQECIRTLEKKGNLQVFGNIGSGQHQTSRDEGRK